MEWCEVIEFEGQYEVSDGGEVRRVGGGRGAVKGRILAQSDHQQGYKVVYLWKDNQQYTYLTHRLVAEAFIGPANGLDVNHKDGDKTNNKLNNLEYMTRSQNLQHAVDNGLWKNKGADNPSNKLTEQQVQNIRSLHLSGAGYKSIAKTYNIAPETVRDIIKGRTWRHLGSIE